ncbi:alpha-L-rhamnosidase [Nesterenkonia lutea]|uniref:alpha-L-rhamnosidase n=1 Tax=Nesterenkonia lutea TaxID=272919 RepID=A0ABR9JH86_9MICC|nr:alpha-L-rhamnosidase [Nesterenkonia lutea]MBE1525299.1 alpha-L-rhamnosidase [Nesterenkonia lutea]
MTPHSPAPLTAPMISPAAACTSAPRFRGTFSVEEGHGPVSYAVLRASALGVYEALLDGQAVSDHVLAPGWTSFEWRLHYQSHDLTPQLRETQAGQRHVLAAVVGRGWCRGQLAWDKVADVYASRPGLLMQLDITFADGHVQTVQTDSTWVVQESEVRADDLFDGQTVDARLRSPGWASPTFELENSQWGAVERSPLVMDLMEQRRPPMRRQQELLPERIWTSPSGATLVDFGQNLVGWTRLSVRGRAGETVRLRHAEVLEHGELGTRPLRSALAADSFILSGAEDIFEPTFTIHGFRYVEISGHRGELRRGDLVAVVVHADMTRTGTFRCSNELVNRLHENVLWSLRGNFLTIPTDCPQRDERLGWTGDIAVFAPAAAHLYDVKTFLGDWLKDLSAEQRAADGVVPLVVPDIIKYLDLPEDFPPRETMAIWSDAAVWVPWALWEAYGDVKVLEDQYESMVDHVQRVESLLSDTGVWDRSFQLGDWLDPDAPPDAPGAAKADPAVVATACAARSAGLLAQSALILGHEQDARRFTDLARRLRDAFNQRYVTPAGLIRSDSATVYALALVFDLLTEEQRPLAARRLADLVQGAGHRISTGFAGTPFVLQALSSTGHVEDAYRLLLQKECPSWLYPVTMGATTVWERWDAMRPDGSINPGQMTSFNHYALGAVAEWLHRVVGGIAPATAGYSRVRVAPRPPGPGLATEMSWAQSTMLTPRGLVSVRWELDQGVLVLTVQLPPGVQADLVLPGQETQELLSGEHTLRVPWTGA